MKGPADLKDILSGLKTKTIQVNDSKPESVASIKEIEELQKDSFKKPKKVVEKIRKKRIRIKYLINLYIHNLYINGSRIFTI